MRVCYRSRPAKAAGVVYQAVGRVQYCCERMRQQWGRLIGFGVLGHRASTSREVNLASAVPQANGRTVLEVVPIECCPFCGETVETCRVK
jgi:hypothetical protein